MSAENGTRMKKLSLPLIMLLSMLDSVTAYGANLDRPAAAKPTIRTELKRGSDVAFGCALRMPANIRAFDQCIEDASQDQARQGTGTDAFSLGLYFNAAATAAIDYESGSSTAFAKAVCVSYVTNVKHFEQALRLTDKDIAKVLGMTDKAIENINKARALQ